MMHTYFAEASSTWTCIRLILSQSVFCKSCWLLSRFLFSSYLFSSIHSTVLSIVMLVSLSLLLMFLYVRYQRGLLCSYPHRFLLRIVLIDIQ
ncbi:hypothetical protein GYMLUDRAFT_280446 [Collybiopsis luxurians FD-317 M1]|nr:hypothetical protein GYMLUDRAFT_280446 [Collybiopsis luxurians FD-317 M1]